MDFAVESTGAAATTVRRAAASPHRDAAAAWARWTLSVPDAPEGGGRRARAWRLIARGPLVPPEPDLEREIIARFGARGASAISVVHRIQAAALIADPTGLPSRIDTDLARGKIFSTDEARWIADAARADLARLFADLERVFPEEDAGEGEALFVSWTGEAKPGRRSAWVLDEDTEGAEPLDFPFAPAEFVPDDDALASLARRLFGVPGLRPGQAEALAALLSGRDVSVAVPTGGGKSLVFHLAALLSPGTALVVAPLRALLRDQERRLAESGIGRVGLLVGDDPASTRRALNELEAGRLILALAAPERLDSAAFRKALRGAAESVGIPFVAVDEAHCAARRGHDWRPGYRALGARLREWCAAPGQEPALAALSGSATPGALAEAARALALRDPVRVRAGAPRGNLRFRVWTGTDDDHLPRLRELLTRRIEGGRFGPGIVFCPRVEGPLGAATIAQELAWSDGIDAAPFTGRPPRGADPERWARDKRRAAEDFLAGRRGLLCATRAFGLGVDRADVRFTVHLGLPASLEEFYQQAGRAGRDGAEASCWIVLQTSSRRAAMRWASLPLERLRRELAELPAGRRDDVSRAYAAHAAGFPGSEIERRDVELALAEIGPLDASGFSGVALVGQDPEALTRALLRLEDAGAISLEERRASGWRVRRVGGWTAGAALAAAGEKIERDYAAVEPARRASLAELVELALSPDAGEALAKRLTACVSLRPEC